VSGATTNSKLSYDQYLCVDDDEDPPDDLVYKIVKAEFEHHQDLADAHPAAKETIPANVDRDTFLPLHPGAVRYYREIGIDVPLFSPAIADHSNARFGARERSFSQPDALDHLDLFLTLEVDKP
jgi:hypothetical protein